MNDRKPAYSFHINPPLIDLIAKDGRLGRSELRVLLHMIANCELYIHSSGVQDDFHRSDLSFLQPGTFVSFITNSTREDMRRELGFESANSITNQLSSLVEYGYLRRFNSIGMRTIFSFMLKTAIFTID